jgi:hypothetical protein
MTTSPKAPGASGTLPDFYIVGAPKAGTTALHAALRAHPRIYLSPVKEPKYFLCAGRPPRRRDQRGPGDAHSAREWVWRRDRYEGLFASAPPGAVRGESTPFYLYDRAAQRRIRELTPRARLIAVLRDPVDRAYSNWMHLWSDGLETIPSFPDAIAAEPDRIAAGYAPFWHYRGLGLYGEQLEHLYSLFPREQVLVLRYRDLVDSPVETLDGVARFLGIEPGHLHAAAPENVRPYVADTARRRYLSRAVRFGSWLGQWAPPQVWRGAEARLLRILHADGAPRPSLPADQRQGLTATFADDIALLERLTGNDYTDWVTGSGRGSFAERRSLRES